MTTKQIKSVIKKFPHSEVRVPFTYHHDYLRGNCPALAGCFEEVQTGCEDSIEVINVTDIDGRIWPGHMARLKNYAKRNNL